MSRVVISIFAAVAMLSGCESLNWWSGPVEQTRLPRDATIYQCEANKKFAVRYDNERNSAMIIFPEREFRLDRVGNPADARYSNGRTTLQVNGDQAKLDEGGTALYDNCKKTS
jgi:membrane-bound inhibitor of C-type lysozyme